MIEVLHEQDLFIQMDRENRNRKDLRPYEQGLMYATALDNGLFPSARKMAEALGIDLTNLGKALALARLPAEVLNAFQNRLDLQYRWATELTKAYTTNPDAVLLSSKGIQIESPRPGAKEVFRRLTQGGSTVLSHKETNVALVGDNGESGSFSFDAKAKTVSMNLKYIDAARAMKIQQFVTRVLNSI